MVKLNWAAYANRTVVSPHSWRSPIICMSQTHIPDSLVTVTENKPRVVASFAYLII